MLKSWTLPTPHMRPSASVSFFTVAPPLGKALPEQGCAPDVTHPVPSHLQNAPRLGAWPDTAIRQSVTLNLAGRNSYRAIRRLRTAASTPASPEPIRIMVPGSGGLPRAAVLAGPSKL